MSAPSGSTRRLMAVPDPDVPTGGLGEDTVPELLAQVHFLRGVLIRSHIDNARDQCGGRGTHAQRDRMRAESYAYWRDQARTPEWVSDEVDHLRELGATGFDPEDAS